MATTDWLSFSSVALDGTATTAYDWDQTDPLNNMLADDCQVVRGQNGADSLTGTHYLSRIELAGISSLPSIYGHLSGIEVKLHRRGSGPLEPDGCDAYTDELYLMWNGVQVGSNLADAAAWFRPSTTGIGCPDSFEEALYGGDGELWGAGVNIASLTGDPSKFGASLRVRTEDSSADGSVTPILNTVMVRFHYNTGAMFAAM